MEENLSDGRINALQEMIGRVVLLENELKKWREWKPAEHLEFLREQAMDKNGEYKNGLAASHLYAKALEGYVKELEAEVADLRQQLAETNQRIDALVRAGEKLLRFWKYNNQYTHHIFCNFPRDEGMGNGRCNCGVSDLLSAIEAAKSEASNEQRA